MRVIHVITGLAPDGAQTMLLKLLQATDPGRIESHVISLTDRGVIGPRIARLGIPVEALNIRPGASAAFAVPQLARHIRKVTPDLVQTWMYHADLLGRFACRSARRPALVWNIRHSELDPTGTKHTLSLIHI